MDDLITFGIMVIVSFLLLTHADKKIQTRKAMKRKHVH
jgi:hypothetical protein